MSDHVHIPDFVTKYWELGVWAIGLTVTGTLWVLRQVFATRASVKQLFEEHEARENLKTSEFRRENVQEHKVLGDDIRWIKNHLIEHNSRRDE